MRTESIKGTDGAVLRVGDRCDARPSWASGSMTRWRRGRIVKIDARHGRPRAHVRWKYRPDLVVESECIRARKKRQVAA